MGNNGGESALPSTGKTLEHSMLLSHLKNFHRRGKHSWCRHEHIRHPLYLTRKLPGDPETVPIWL